MDEAITRWKTYVGGGIRPKLGGNFVPYAAHIAAVAAERDAVRDAAQEIINGLSSSCKLRNGRKVNIEGDDGEKCWILSNDGYEALCALRTTTKEPT